NCATHLGDSEPGLLGEWVFLGHDSTAPVCEAKSALRPTCRDAIGIGEGGEHACARRRQDPVVDIENPAGLACRLDGSSERSLAQLITRWQATPHIGIAEVRAACAN